MQKLRVRHLRRRSELGELQGEAGLSVGDLGADHEQVHSSLDSGVELCGRQARRILLRSEGFAQLVHGVVFAGLQLIQSLLQAIDPVSLLYLGGRHEGDDVTLLRRAPH